MSTPRTAALHDNGMWTSMKPSAFMELLQGKELPVQMIEREPMLDLLADLCWQDDNPEAWDLAEVILREHGRLK